MSIKTFVSVTCVFLCTFLPLGIRSAEWYVDASVAESGNGMTWGTAFKAIQEGIGEASGGDTVTVAEGTYHENIHFQGKSVVLRSTDPTDHSVVQSTVIDGQHDNRVKAEEALHHCAIDIDGNTATLNVVRNNGSFIEQNVTLTPGQESP